MNQFEYSNPSTLAQATALLADTWGEAEILAGGTDLITSLKQNLTHPRRLVSLKAIGDLRKIEVHSDGIRIGAMTTLTELSAHAVISERFPSLIAAAEGVASPQMMAMGTVGGDLCQRPRCWYYRQGFGLLARYQDKPLVPDGDNRYHAIFAVDGPAYFVNPSSLAPALIALGATLTLTGPNLNQRQVKCEEFFRVPKAEGQRENVLQPNEIITDITVPLSFLRNSTYEVRYRRSLDWPLVTASVAFDYRGSLAKQARIVLGHVAPIPWVCKKAAFLLEGKSIDEALAARCGKAATDGATPLSKNGYKVHLVKAAVKRALLAASGKKG